MLYFVYKIMCASDNKVSVVQCLAYTKHLMCVALFVCSLQQSCAVDTIISFLRMNTETQDIKLGHWASKNTDQGVF